MKKAETLIEEIKNITSQYRAEVGSRRKPWPNSIIIRVQELMGLGFKIKKISDMTGIFAIRSNRLKPQKVLARQTNRAPNSFHFVRAIGIQYFIRYYLLMKNGLNFLILITLFIALIFGIFKNYSREPKLDLATEREQVESPVLKNNISVKELTLNKNLLTKISSEGQPQVESNSTPARESAQKVENNSNKIHQISYSKKIADFYNRIKDIPIDEELKRLKPIQSTFTGEERFFPYFYKGELEGDIEKRIIRLNLAFKNFGPDLGESACFFLGSLDKFEIQTTASEGLMQILRSNDPGYIVVNIKNEYFLQIFQTSDRPRRRYKSLLTIRKNNKKYPLFLEGIDGTLQAGRAPTCYELSFPTK